MYLTLNCGKAAIIHTQMPAFIMGIINTSPDSFFSESCSTVLHKNLERALSMVANGADILDIGGESTRPGASYIEADEEIERVIPLIEEIHKRTAVPVSVDTRKAAVMQAAFHAGASICNDISALTDDVLLGNLIAEHNGTVILMHKAGIPKTMQQHVAHNPDIVLHTETYLKTRIKYALSCGIGKDNIIIDYGIGFGKTAEDNYRLIAATRRFTELGYPLLVGLSRKSFIGAATGEPPAKRLIASISTAQYAVEQGAAIVRVHDVKETREMLCMIRELRKHGNN